MASMQTNNRNPCPTIYFAKVPNFQDLCTVSLQVTSDSPGISNLAQFGSQPQIIKCRELIFTEPNVLASPSLQEQGLIFVIIQQSFWKTGKLQARCQKSGLKINKPTRVIPAVFQACLSYTLKAKLAPLWNKAGDLYIQGRDFLVTSTKAKAVGVEINVTDAEICIALKPVIVKLSQSDIRDFDIAPGVLDHFFSSITNSIPEYAIEDKWCHILPSLKKGKLVSITHQIPSVSPFKTYKDIRRYWKNAYGYRLPESDTGIIYYNIYFPAIGHTLFTYPDFCVFKREPVLLPRADPMTIIPLFLADVQAKLPNICGFPFKVNPKAQYPTTGLYQASIQNNSLSRLTLSTMPPQHPNYPIRQIAAANHNNQIPQHRPNRVLAKAFDAAFQQAGNRVQPNQTQMGTSYISTSPLVGSRTQPNQTQMGTSYIPTSPLVNSRTQPNQTQMGTSYMPTSPLVPQHSALNTSLGVHPLSQHGAMPPSANMQSHPHISASPMRHPRSGGLEAVSHRISAASPMHPRSGGLEAASHRISAASPMHPRTGSVEAANPSGQLGQFCRSHMMPALGAISATNHHMPASPIAHPSGVTANPGLQPFNQHVIYDRSPHEANIRSLSKYRAILPASPPPSAPPHFQRRLTYQSPPTGLMSPTTSMHHQKQPQSPCAATCHHTAIHHSPLMSNSAAQHSSQLYRSISSPTSIPTSHLGNQFASHPGQASQTQVMNTSPYGSFRFPSSPPPMMLTPVPQQSPLAVAKIVPSFRPHKPRNVSYLPQASSSQPSKVVPVFKPAAKRSITPTFAAKVQLNFDAEPKEDQPPRVAGSTTPGQQQANHGTSQQMPMKPTFGAKTPSAPVGSKLGKPSKRKAKESENEPTAKKQRAKPKVQDVDMQSLMINDQLSKVNTITLVTWLKDKDIKVKSREKKPDLIAKVIAYINAKSKEH